MMNLNLLRTFIVVASNRSFARASEQLYISQPAISQQISRMEAELGFSLLRRDHHSVELTPAGNLFLKGAEEIINSYDTMTGKCRRIASDISEINIGCTGNTQFIVFPQLMAVFSAEVSNCSLTAFYIKPDDIFPVLKRGSVSVVLTPYDMIEANKEIKYRHLFYDRDYCVMNKNHPLAKNSSLTLQQLEGMKLLFPEGIYRPKHMSVALEKIEHTVPSVKLYNGKHLNNAAARVTITDELMIVPGFTLPEHPSLVAIPLDDGIEIEFVAAYLGSLTP